MKMTVKTPVYDVGVIVGRFQVPELHEAHRALIQHVCDEHHKVVIFLGLSPLMVTQENPLDFESRKQMLLEAFPDVNVLYIKDMNDDRLWSARLDDMINDLRSPGQSAVLYGGRDSFMNHYLGQFPTKELEQDVWVSGTEIRSKVAKRRARPSTDFRAGVVWAAYSHYQICLATVDVAIYNEDESKLLLGKKPQEPLFRFIGGFSDPSSPTYEADARREVQEEAGIAITDPQYVGSFLIDDWRYRNERDKIKTLLFRAKHLFGAPKPADDIAEVRWFECATLSEDQVMPAHRVLLRALTTPDTDKGTS